MPNRVFSTLCAFAFLLGATATAGSGGTLGSGGTGFQPVGSKVARAASPCGLGGTGESPVGSGRMADSAMQSTNAINTPVSPAPPSAPLTLTATPTPSDFPLVTETAAARIHYSDTDAKVVAIAARDLATDIERITGKRPELTTNNATAPTSITTTASTPDSPAILIGTLGNSPPIDALAASGKLDLSALRGQWETFLIATVETAPRQHALVIVGSDPRGTAYGVYELSQAIGVSPWHWWADVAPEKKSTLHIAAGARLFGPPSVKYRGIFINDEDWGLHPWAAKTFEPENGGIGPRTYEKVFELLLRLKANTLWPAMRPCSPAFDSNPANAALASDHAIIIGAPPDELISRNNNDGTPAQPAETKDAQIARLEKTFADQRALPAEQAPKIFCVIKETIDLYRGGLRVPDDVTVMFTDDNYGYIHNFPSTADRAAVRDGTRTGGFGIYYHLSYLGRPMSYLWLATTPPALIWEEMRKAHSLGADRIWIANVGDIKPAEITTEFFLQMAWNIDVIPTANTQNTYLQKWAAREFDAEHAADIARLMDMYYRFNFERRPEHLQWWLPRQKPRPSTFTPAQRERRDALARSMNERLAKIRERIPAEKQDAFYQLVEYPVQGSILANNRYFTGEEAALKYLAGDKAALDKFGYQGDVLNGQLARITHRYNNLTAGGKWRHLMQLEPADGQWKTMRISPWRVPNFRQPLPPAPKNPIATVTLTGTRPGAMHNWTPLAGLGSSGTVHSIQPKTTSTIPLETVAANAPALDYEYTLATPPAATTLRIHILPTHAIDGSGKLRIAYTLDDGTEPQPAELVINDGGSEWAQGVLANKRTIDIPLPTSALTPGRHTLRIYGIAPSVIIDCVTIE